MKVFIRGVKIVGTTDHILVEPDSHRMTHLVVQRGGTERQAAYMIPAERIILTTEDSLWLNMDEKEFDQSPVYQTPASDEQIAARLQRALDTDVRTRGAGLHVDVKGGLVRFVGRKIDQVIDTASKIARSIQGVVGISNDIEAPPEPPLRIGEPVYAREVHYGTLAKVVVDPYKRQVTHVIVKHGKLLGKDRVIPIERLDRVEFDRIFIDATSEELDHYPRYEEKKFVEPLPGWEALDPDITADTLFWGGPYTGIAPFILPTIEHIVPVGVPKGELVLQRDTDVFYENDVVGALDHLLMDPTNGAVNYIVIKLTDSDQRVIVPTEWISQLDADAIVLNRWDPFQSGVPESEMMADDDIILADLTAHFHATPRLEKVNLLVDHHWVHLSGNVAKMEDKQAAESIARSTPGVVGVTSSLVSDTELVGRVLSELAADRHTRPYTFNVNADRGVIMLQGSVPREEIRAAAEAVVQRIAGVIKVINQLEILPEP